MRRPASGLVVAALLLAGCGGDAGTTQGATAGGGELPHGLARCPGDRVLAAADASHYRDEPVYVGNEMPVEEVRAWAAAQPAFEEIWIDRDHNGWISVGFSEGADDRQAELEQEFPGVGVVAVPLDWTAAELEALRAEAFGAMEDAGFPVGGSHSVPAGLVEVFVGELDDEHLAPLADLAGPRLCVDGVDSDDVIREGPQPTQGDGWRLLGADRTGQTYRTGVATSQEQYESLWLDSGVSGEPPAVDFDSEIVIWFGAVYGSGCEVRLDDVVVDADRAVVHADLVIPGVHQGCNDDANPAAYLVALQRDRLPVGGFVVQIGPDDPPAGVPEERTVVDVDLRSPGSTAQDEEIHQDEELVGRTDRYVVAAGGVIEPGYPAAYDLDLSCTFSTFGPLNEVVWQADAQGLDAAPPEAWLAAADDRGIVEVEVLIETDPARLRLTANGHTERYVPSPGATGTCP
ncbi:MAG: hypothetical protein ACSLFP_11225 [Acidimicrobiales bacterium]